MARYSFNGSEFTTERAVMLGDFYLKDVWRFAAVGQGFDGGLEALLKNFGGEVMEEEVPAAQQPQSGAAPGFAPPPQGAAPPAFGAPAPAPAPVPQPAAQGFVPPPAPAPAPSVHGAPTIIAPMTPPGGAPVPPPAPAPAPYGQPPQPYGQQAPGQTAPLPPGYGQAPPPPPGYGQPPAPPGYGGSNSLLRADPRPGRRLWSAQGSPQGAGVSAALEKFKETPTGQRWTQQNKKLIRVDLGIGGQPVLARQGSMVLYQGKVDFGYKGAGFAGRLVGNATGQEMQLMRCTGQGQVFLAENSTHLHPVELQGTRSASPRRTSSPSTRASSTRSDASRDTASPGRAVHDAVPGDGHHRRQDARLARGAARHADHVRRLQRGRRLVRGRPGDRLEPGPDAPQRLSGRHRGERQPAVPGRPGNFIVVQPYEV